jgi:hypothetical protein
MAIASGQQIDANSRTVNSNDAFLLASTWTFAATTTGTQAAHTLFTVTGDVLVNVFATCTTDVTGSGTGAVGTANNTQAFIATTTGTDIDAKEVWQNATPTAEVGAVVSTSKPVSGSTDIILTIGTNTLTGGVVNFYCLWRPLSSTGNVTVTTPA